MESKILGSARKGYFFMLQVLGDTPLYKAYGYVPHQRVGFLRRFGLKTGMDLDCKTVRIFTYSSTREQSNKRSGMRLKQRARLGFFSLASHARRACEARALRARKTLTPRFTDFFTDFEKKTDCFAV